MFFSYYIKYTSSIFLLFTIPFLLQSQSLERELVAANGAIISTTNIQLEWSVGEVVVGDFMTDNWLLTQGFHQGIQDVIDEVTTPQFDYAISLFPNPTTDNVFFSREQLEEDVYIEIYNELGQQLFRELWLYDQHQVDVSTYSSGIYWALVRGENHSTIFKFIVAKD